MARLKTKYTCQQCGYSSAGWLGKCPSCGSWGTLEEEAPAAAPGRQARPDVPESRVQAYRLIDGPGAHTGSDGGNYAEA